jgi:hypothetical protein
MATHGLRPRLTRNAPARWLRACLIGLGVLATARVVDAAPGDDPRPEPPRVFLLNGPRLAEIRERVERGDPGLAGTVKRLRSRADDALKTPVLSVVDKPMVPPSGDKHDYVSLAPYWWPDPKKPDGKPYIRKDGRTNPERSKFDAPKLGRLYDSVPTLALASYLTGDRRYSEHAARLVRAWFIDPKTRMNSNLNFGQFVPGQNDGRSSGIIETRGLIQVADAVGLLEGAPGWSADDSVAIRGWYRSYLDWLRESPIGGAERRASNNHGCWYDAQVVAFALFVDDAPLARQVLEAGQETRIARQIEPDGRLPRELERTKSFDYCLFNLDALTTLATFGDRAGVDLWRFRTPDGRSIRGAIDWMIPYATGEKRWTHEQIARVRPAKLLPTLRRAANGCHEPAYERVLAGLVAKGERLDELFDLLEPPAGSK